MSTTFWLAGRPHQVAEIRPDHYRVVLRREALTTGQPKANGPHRQPCGT
jgi:hypothetical protein